MMVFDQTSIAMSNKTALTMSPTETKLDTRGSSTKSSKTLPKRLSSFSKRRTSLTKSVSETIKKTIAKELKPSKSESGKIGSSKDKKERKKKKTKKSSSDSSLKNKEGSATDANASMQNITFPLHPPAPPARSYSEYTGKKRAKQRSSSKKMKTDSMLVDELIQNHKSLGISEHTTGTISLTGSVDNEDSSSNYKKATTKKKSKRTDNKIPKAPADKSSSEEDDMLPLTTSPHATLKKHPAPKNRQTRLSSFESIHGKSIHIPKVRRGSMTNTTTDITEIRNGNHVPMSPMSPTQTFGNLTSPPSSGTRKKSVLLAKREKQKQEQAEQETNELKSRLVRSMVQKKKEDHIHDVLDIVKSNHNPENKAVPSREFLANTPCDPDECSSQSSSCSIVSDGSYEKDDLLSHTSDHSDERNMAIETPDNFSLEENPSFDDASFAMEIESPMKGSYTDRNLVSPSEESFTESLSNRDADFKDSLMEAMASSMSALQEVDDENDHSPKPRPSTKKSVLKKALKVAASVGKPPLRLVPKRSQSDVTSLKSISNSLANNTLRVRLPGQRKTITRQRSLTFNEKVRVKRVPCQAQVAEGDVADLWFQAKEYDAIKRKTMALIRAVQDDQTGGVTYCTRGLERYFSVDNVQEKRNDAWDSVLDEQEAQRANREAFNADRMSQAYAKTTRLSSQEAVERGKLDEDAIARYTKKMRQTLRRTYSMPV